MSASKTLTSAVAAATIVGAIGFAYAQTSDSTAPASGDAAQTQSAPTNDQSTQPQGNMQSAPSQSTTTPSDSTAAPSSTDSSTAPSGNTSTTPADQQPAPKADRN